MPVWVTVGTGYPVLVKVKVKAMPWVAVAEEALVMAGASSTVSVKVCVAEPKLFVASEGQRVDAALTLSRRCRPGWRSRCRCRSSVRPAGKGRTRSWSGTGAPVALTVKLKVEPTVAVALAALVMVGPASTVSTKVWVVVPAELVAVNVMV